MKLTAQAIERINTNALVAELMARGWNAYLPVYDEGIDLLATQDDCARLLKIQLKSRWTIDKKYHGRDIHIAFREGDVWYLVPHDEAVSMGNELGYCARASWTKGGQWSVGSMSAALLKMMAPYALDSQLGPSRL